METYEIHNREVLLKGLATCAGECCKDDCPYYGKTGNGTSCRVRLLGDAMAALTKDKDDLDALEAAANTYRDERDKLREGWHDLCNERDKLAAEVDDLETANNTIRAERDGMRIELERLTADNKRFRMLCQGITDRPSVSDDALKNEYKRGYLDAMEYCFRELCKRAGGGGCHE